MTVFEMIKTNLVNAIRAERTFGSITFKAYPYKQIIWLCKQGVFKVEKLEKEDGKYILHYKNMDTSSNFLKSTYEYLERKGLIGEHKNESITNKFGHIYSKYRQELECPNWSSEPDEYGYVANPFGKDNGFEKLDKADSCMFDLVIQELGYENYEDFVKHTNEEERKVIEESLEYKEEELKAQTYSY